MVGPGPSICGKKRESPKSNSHPEFWLSGGSHLVLHLCNLKVPKLRVRSVRSSTETDSNLLNVCEETQITASTSTASLLEKAMGTTRAVKAVIQNYRK